MYGNMYNPDHPEADEQGFRKDIMKHLKDLKTTLIRYPGEITFQATAGLTV